MFNWKIKLIFSVFSSLNLYELIKKNNYQGFSLGLIRRFAQSLVQCLKLLYKENIIHCDLKPVSLAKSTKLNSHYLSKCSKICKDKSENNLSCFQTVPRIYQRGGLVWKVVMSPHRVDYWTKPARCRSALRCYSCFFRPWKSRLRYKLRSHLSTKSVKANPSRFVVNSHLSSYIIFYSTCIAACRTVVSYERGT